MFSLRSEKSEKEMQGRSGEDMQGGSGEDNVWFEEKKYLKEQIQRERVTLQSLKEQIQIEHANTEVLLRDDHGDLISSQLEEEHSELIKEIISLGRERKDLLDSLTPSAKMKSSQAATTRRKSNKSSVSSSYKANWQNELAGYLDSVLEDVADLGHRMLSMAHVTMESDAPMSISSSYKANELVNRTSRLMHISEEFYKDYKEVDEVDCEALCDVEILSQLESQLAIQLESEKKMDGLNQDERIRSSCRTNLLKQEIILIRNEREERLEEMRERKNQMWMASLNVDYFLCLSRNYLQNCGSSIYKNELALILSEEKGKAIGEEEEEEEEEEKERKEKEEIERKEKEKDPSTLGFLNMYKNELALILTEEKGKAIGEEEEEEEEEEKERKEKEEIERKEKEKDPSTLEFLNMVMGFYQKIFADHRDSWERVWGSNIGRCGGFGDTTTLSSMHFTHYTPNTPPSPAAALSGSTLQIYSIKIRKVNGNLNWPLKVYGVVAARDTVDRNRNILFSRSRRNYQVLTADDPFLCLTGPSRAILAVDPVAFEVKLKINKSLISLHKSYHASGSTSLFFHSFPPKNRDDHDYVAELSVGRLATPLQATIVGVCVVEGVWPFQHGCRVVCSSSAADEVIGVPTPEVVLLDYRGEMMRVGLDGYLHLSRNVVSVEFNGRLRIDIHAYSEFGCQAQGGHVDFPAQRCQTSKGGLLVGNSKLEIVVAWSFLVKDKLDLLLDCPDQP